MSKALAALASRVRKPRPLNPMADFRDDIIADMASAISVLGGIEEARSGWRGTSIQLVQGVDMAISMPREPMVEMDGVSLFDLLVKGAESGAEAVIKAIGLPAAQAWAKIKIDEETHAHEPKAVVIAAVMFEVMRAQGWVRNGVHWKSPVWLYPPCRIPYEAVLARATEAITPNPTLTMESE